MHPAGKRGISAIRQGVGAASENREMPGREQRDRDRSPLAQPAAAADAPGRVNLIGEHTDYNGGYVLPLALPLRTRVEIRRRPDGMVRAWTANVAAARTAGGGRRGAVAEYRLGGETPGRGWLDYVQGVTDALGRQGFALSGCEVRIESTVPAGAGLSSSAALTVALLRGCRSAFGLAIDDLGIARLAQQAENQFVGAPVGIMDPIAVSLGDERHALFLDTRNLAFERVALPAAVELAVIDSGIAHRHAGGEYAARRAECERAARLLGVGQLRELEPADLPRLARLPPPLDRRARHVVDENARVLAAVRALRDGDAERLGTLLDEAHRSLSEDFSVSLPEIDLLVGLARADPAVYGARLTGGGFGGAIVLAARPGTARDAACRVVAAYRWRGGRAATVVVPPG
jgi:galactokinase